MRLSGGSAPPPPRPAPDVYPSSAGGLRIAGDVGRRPVGLGGAGWGEPNGETARVTLLKALTPLRVSSWNSQALLGGMWSRSGCVSAKRRECERLLGRSDVVLFQEAHGSLAGLTLMPAFHEYFGSFGDLAPEEASSTWGGIIIAVRRTRPAT